MSDIKEKPEVESQIFSPIFGRQFKDKKDAINQTNDSTTKTKPVELIDRFGNKYAKIPNASKGSDQHGQKQILTAQPEVKTHALTSTNFLNEYIDKEVQARKLEFQKRREKEYLEDRITDDPSFINYKIRFDDNATTNVIDDKSELLANDEAIEIIDKTEISLAPNLKMKMEQNNLALVPINDSKPVSQQPVKNKWFQRIWQKVSTK